MGDYYILEGHKAVECKDLKEWGEVQNIENRKVKRETVGEADVSTVFLGLDHSFGSGPPLLFETIVFGGNFDGEMNRYETWDEAVTGHDEMVQFLKDHNQTLI